MATNNELFGLKTQVAGDGKSIKFNDDGTLTVDIFRTGTWNRYGLIEVTENDLSVLQKNFANRVMKYTVTFNYHHDRKENFGTPISLMTETRISSLTGKPFTMLMAKTELTEKAKADVEAGEIINFSSEINNDYIDREVVMLDELNADGSSKPDEMDADKNARVMMKKRYGMTLCGGAVTNYPFITDLNPAGLGGNDKKFSFLSDDVDPETLKKIFEKFDKNQLLSMLSEGFFFRDSTDKKEKTDFDNNSLLMLLFGMGQKSVTYDEQDFNDIIAELTDPVFIEDSLYERTNYAAGDAALPDAAYAIVYDVKNKRGGTTKIRKLPHHNKSVVRSDEHSSIDKPRLQNALARLNQVDAPTEKITAAKTHLNMHGDVVFKSSKETPIAKVQKNSEEYNVMGAENTEFKFDINDPEIMKLMNAVKEQAKSEFSVELAKRDEKITKQESLLSEFTEQNKDLKVQVEQHSAQTISAKREAHIATISRYADGICGGKAPASLKEVVRCGLRENAGATVKYFDTTKNEVVSISLQEYTDKLFSSIPAVDGVSIFERKSVDPVVETTNLSVDKDDLSEEEYKEVMLAHKPKGNGAVHFKSLATK